MTARSKSLDSILNQYEKAKPDSSGGYEKTSVDLKKYFSEKLREGQKDAEFRIRILPDKDGNSPFVEAYWHEIKVNGKWQKIYCTHKNDGERCPLCESHEALKMTGKKSDKELSKQFIPKKYYVVKVIDREKEDEGVKFWRFKYNWKNEGIYDKLIPIFKKRGDITDPRTGRDVTLTSSRDKEGYSKLTSIVDEDPSILTDPKSEKAKLWVTNTETYKDVYKVKPMDYMEIVAKGLEPAYDKEKGKWVSKEDLDSNPGGDLDEEIKITKNQNTSKANKKPEVIENNDDEYSDETEEDDLPF